MKKIVVHVVGVGTIGEPLIGLLCDFKDQLGIDDITFHKNTPLTRDRAKVISLMDRGAHLTTHKDKIKDFADIGLNVEYDIESAIDRATVVIDCTPKGKGHANKKEYYEKYSHNTLGFIAQGSEFGFGKMYARGINDSALKYGGQFIQVVSCNTHNIAVMVKTLSMINDWKYDNNGIRLSSSTIAESNLQEGRFILIRRANDVSQNAGFISAPSVDIHKDEIYGTHHAKDASLLFNTINVNLNLFSSSMKVNSQYMHVLHFYLKLKTSTTLNKIKESLFENDNVAVTDKMDVNEVFSFGRDHGHYGRILNQTVVSLPSLNLSNGTVITGFCFTPQDGNSLLSSVSAAMWFIDPENYEKKIQCLDKCFYDEV